LPRGKKIIDKLPVEEIRALYWQEQKSTYEISLIFGCCYSTIRDLLFKNGGLRRKTDAARLAIAQGRRKQKNLLKGSDSPSWKGGRYESKEGYVFIYLPNYHRAMSNGYVREHILVWEEAHGEILPKGWEVHHLNGIKNDNAPDNLCALRKKKHQLWIPALQERIRTLERALKDIAAHCAEEGKDINAEMVKRLVG